MRFTIAEFDRLINRIAKAAKTGQPIVPADYHPELKRSGAKMRELPLADHGLIDAIARYLNHRSALPKPLTPNAALVLSQKGGPYSPNTLQDHIAMMLRAWTGIERATSHSGRRTLATKLLHEQGEHLKTVQQVLGHKDAATTTIYQDLTEGEIKKTLKKAGLSYDE